MLCFAMLCYVCYWCESDYDISVIVIQTLILILTVIMIITMILIDIDVSALLGLMNTCQSNLLHHCHCHCRHISVRTVLPLIRALPLLSTLNIRNNYFLTEKSDGTRYLLYVIDTSRQSEVQNDYCQDCYVCYSVFYSYFFNSIFFIIFYFILFINVCIILFLFFLIFQIYCRLSYILLKNKDKKIKFTTKLIFDQLFQWR